MGKKTEMAKKMVFRVKWAFMPPQKRYAYLWARTQRSLTQSAVRTREDDDTLLAG